MLNTLFIYVIAQNFTTNEDSTITYEACDLKFAVN